MIKLKLHDFCENCGEFKVVQCRECISVPLFSENHNVFETKFVDTIVLCERYELCKHLHKYIKTQDENQCGGEHKNGKTDD